MFDLGVRHREVQEAARAVAAAVEEFAGEADESTSVHAGVLEALRAGGLARHVVPAAFGGESETLDPLTIAVIREALMYSSAHLDSLFGMQGVGSYPLAAGGSDELRRAWLPRVAALEAIAGLALTEPDVGSDLRAVTTMIESVPGGLRVTGRKSFITNGGAAGFYCVLGREGTAIRWCSSRPMRRGWGSPAGVTSSRRTSWGSWSSTGSSSRRATGSVRRARRSR
ncbi:acyl-CoA dehydrogenase family protein [Actinomadura madurae]|uniref:acyl-CoA dehydrogenase family protein n=1 Tax=Actinomadura madurae TaxID=1993 RepID=UPI0020D255B9|nr:acyl-CoA dehydrogenase family protein [Actinomadura madurae]MCP9977483.1 acyl-CoA dehydrogenase family protein [Actinomadura madurae]